VKLLIPQFGVRKCESVRFKIMCISYEVVEHCVQKYTKFAQLECHRRCCEKN